MFGNSTFGFLTQAFDFKLPRIPTVGGMSLGIGPDMFDQAKRQLKGLATNWLIGGLFRKEHYSRVTDRINQYMEEHGYIKFVFGDDDFLLPFFENPSITESRNANYASTPVMNRNEPWRLWTGASPEKVDISFNMTLPHIMQFAIKTAFQTNIVGAGYEEQHSDKTWDAWIAATSDYDVPQFEEWVESREYVVSGGTKEPPSQRTNGDDYELTLYVSHMIDLIRASVIGSVEKDYVAGPPVVNLKFGTLYNDSPFMVTSYTFKFEGKEGYHNETLLPRRIKVRMSLESLHQAPESALPGWDSILHL
tara:strand:+ start:906 stop:1823 length:918 start_codon:yes stop_codon:yes gene_type:complete